MLKNEDIYYSKKIFIICTILVSLMVSTCSNQSSHSKSLNTANPQVSFRLTDFPLGSADITSFNITVQRIEVMNKGGEWFTVANYSPNGLILDLLRYQNGISLEIGNFTLEPGTYSQMRMVIDPNVTIVESTAFGQTQHIVNANGETFKYIKVLDKFNVDKHNNAQIMIDFNAKESLRLEVDHYVFTPHIRLKYLDTDDHPITLTPVSILGADFQPFPPLNSSVSGSIKADGLMAINSVSIDSGSIIESNISVLGSCSIASQTICKDDHGNDCSCKARNICLNGSSEVNLGANTHLMTGFLVFANRITIGQNALVDSLVYTNIATVDPTAVVASLNSPLTMVPKLPEFFGGYKSNQDVTGGIVALNEGIYHNLYLGHNESINLTGGNYHFEQLNIGDHSKLICQSTCQIYVRKGITAGINFLMTSTIGSSNSINVYLGEVEIERNQTVLETDSVYFTTGDGSQITGNFYALYGIFNIGSNNIFTGTLIAYKISIGVNSHIVSNPPSIIVDKNYAAQANYNGVAFQLEFIDSTRVRMINSQNPSYVYNGTYEYNLATKIILFNYQTVDLIDPNCLSCQITGIYPPVSTYPVNAADIPIGFWGIEITGQNNNVINANIVADNTPVIFNRRPVFGPFDTIF